MRPAGGLFPQMPAPAGGGLLTPGLMPPDNPELRRNLAATTNGMAGYGGTGPEGTTCRQCASWGRSDRFRRDAAGALNNRRCLKFTTLTMGSEGPGVPHGQASCRHYTPRETALAEVKPSRLSLAAAVAATQADEA